MVAAKTKATFMIKRIRSARNRKIRSIAVNISASDFASDAVFIIERNRKRLNVENQILYYFINVVTLEKERCVR